MTDSAAPDPAEGAAFNAVDIDGPPVSPFVFVAAAVDIIGVIVFVILGRQSHDEGKGAMDTLEIAAPFLLALAVAWIGTRAWRHVTNAAVAAIIGLVTVGLGLVIRRFVFDRGTAPGFVIVTTIVLGGYLVGWRFVARRTGRRRRARM